MHTDSRESDLEGERPTLNRYGFFVAIFKADFRVPTFCHDAALWLAGWRHKPQTQETCLNSERAASLQEKETNPGNSEKHGSGNTLPGGDDSTMGNKQTHNKQ